MYLATFPSRFVITCKDKKELEEVTKQFEALTDQEGRSYSLIYKENEDGSFDLMALPYAEEGRDDDAEEVWCACIPTEINDDDIITAHDGNTLIESYVERVKKSPSVKKGVTLLARKGKKGVVFDLLASSVIASGKKGVASDLFASIASGNKRGRVFDIGVEEKRGTAERIRAAVSGFKHILNEWIFKNHEDELEHPYELLLEAQKLANGN